MASDIDIARTVTLRPIQEIGAMLQIAEDDLQLYGRYKAKIPLNYIRREGLEKKNLILVTAISPTPAGEGKTTMSIGLTQGMNRLGKQTTVVLREPSLGPVFGIKGGATGGGYSQVLPMEDINLHFTGDFAAVEKAHNLLSALIDNNLQARARNLGLDPRSILWKRVMDMNDRSLRHITAGLGGSSMGVPRETGFDITAASEIMAILCLSDDLVNLKERMGNILVGFTWDKQPVFARDLHAQGAMAALMKDAIQPNLVQTLEGTPAIIHGGPFANIAQGTNSVIATRMGLSLSDYVVTEAGFGADLGAEKFFDIKCGYAGLSPRTVVLVATIRALKYHGGASLKHLTDPDVTAVVRGLPNMEKHLENIARFGVPAVVAINRFPTDTDAEVQAVKDHCRSLGIRAETVTAWADGGAGAEAIASAVLEAIPQSTGTFRPVYDWKAPVKEKIESIATTIYGADGVDYTPAAQTAISRIERIGLSALPVCMAKTQKSLSDNPDLLGRPKGFRITVRDIEIAAGAGFLVPITGEMMRMPGLPATPAAEHIDINAEGEISGLF
jgi:formate--tetrahydrofolate ligase